MPKINITLQTKNGNRVNEEPFFTHKFEEFLAAKKLAKILALEIICSTFRAPYRYVIVENE